MKKYFLLLLVVSLSLLSCTKELETPEKDITELLVGVSWKIHELTFVQNNTLFYYLRGGQNNTANYFDGDVLKFNDDQTGTYSTGAVTYEISWEFKSEDKKALSYIIFDYDKGAPKTGVNTEVRLENISLTENKFRYAEIYTNSEQKSTISSVTRIPL